MSKNKIRKLKGKRYISKVSKNKKNKKNFEICCVSVKRFALIIDRRKTQNEVSKAKTFFFFFYDSICAKLQVSQEPNRNSQEPTWNLGKQR